MREDGVGGDDRDESETVEGVAVADAGGGINVDDGVDVEVHGEHAVGAGHGREGHGGGTVTGGMEGDLVPGERELRLADGVVGVGRDIVADDKRKVDGGVAARGIGDDHGVLTLIIKGNGVVDVVGQFVLDDRGSEGTLGGIPDGEVQGDHTVAAHGIGEGDRRGVGALGVGDAVDPGEGVAGVNGDGAGRRLVDGQMQGDGGVASVGGAAGEGMGVAVALRVGLSVPVEGAAGRVIDVGEGMRQNDGEDGVRGGAAGGGLGGGDGVEAVVLAGGVFNGGVLPGGVEAVGACPCKGHAGVVGVGGELDGTALAG